MKSTAWLVLIILMFLKASSEENSTLVYYVELEIEETALSHFTTLFNKLEVNVEGHNAQVTNIALTTECDSNNCTCKGNYTWSNEVCTKHPDCCQRTSSCLISSLDSYSMCIPKERVIVNGSFTIQSIFFDGKSFEDLTTATFTYKLASVYSTMLWFNSLNITSLRKGSIIGDFVIQFDDEFSVSKLETKTEELIKQMNATFNLVTKGLIKITRSPSGIINSADVVNIQCEPHKSLAEPHKCLGDAKWFIQRGVEKKEVTNGTESTVSPNDSKVLINKTSEFWKGTFICDYMSDTSEFIIHRASIDLDIAILPEIFITSEPQFPHCKNTSENIKITILCIIQTSLEIYTFSPQPFVIELHKDKMYYMYEKSISCGDNSTVNTCTFTNRGNQSKNATLEISVIRPGDKFCTADTTWPEAKANCTAKLLCPQSSLNKMERKCFENGTYNTVISECVDQGLYELWNNAKDIQRGIGNVSLDAINVFSNLKQSTEQLQPFSNIDAFACINTSVDIMHLMQSASQIQNTLWNESMLPDILDSSSNLLNDSLLAKWKERDTTSLAVKYLMSLENLLQQTNVTNVTSMHATCQQNNVQIIAMNSSAQPGLQCTTKHNISIKSSGSNILFQTVIRNLDQLLPLNDNMSSNGIIFSVVANNTGQKEISIKWVTNRLRNHKIYCVYFDTKIKQWSDNLCTWDYNQNLCKCTHLSAFTILMSKSPVKLSYMEELTYIGLAFSICSLAFCLLIELVVWNTVVKSSISHFKHTVLVNIILCLLLAHCCFLASDLKSAALNQWCLALTILKHFFFLAMFFWMMCFSMGLLHQLTFYFVQLRKKVYLWLCFSFGYACPLLIVIVTVITYNNGALDSYYVNETCWLRYESPLHGSIHFFIVPVGMIVLVNMFTMVVVISKLLKPTMSEGSTQDEKEIVRGIIKTIVLLTPILGTTWILGFFVLIIDLTSKPFAEIVNYAFTLFNSLQGFFILLTGFCADKKVRNALLTHLRQKHVAINRGEISTTMTAAIKKK